MERLPTNPTVEDFFKLYITEDMIDDLVIQTNLYARQFLTKKRTTSDHIQEYMNGNQPIGAEMLTFLAILILMGIVHKPKLPMYWSTDSTWQHQSSNRL